MEPTQANVVSIEVLQRLRTAMIRCREELGLAISEADSDVDRTVVWVEHDRIMHWRGRVQRLGEDLNNARSALFRKETVTSSKDSKPSVVDEKKTLERVKASLADAERRGQLSRAWATALPREQALLKAGIGPIAAMVDRDLPLAIAALERMSISLERYARDAAVDLRSLLEPEVEAEKVQGTRRSGGGPPSVEGQSP